MTAGSDDWGLAEQRNRYQEDTFGWLYRRFEWVSGRIDDRTEWQANVAKELAQATAHALTKSLTHARDSLTLWLALIALVALASSGLWIGVGGVLIILAWRWYSNRSAAALSHRFEKFRKQCYAKLLEIADGRGNPEARMLEEDKEFVRTYRDIMFYPLTVRPEDHKRPNIFDLERIETLYWEHCDWLAHFHPRDRSKHDQGGDPNLAVADPKLTCGLCAPIYRVRVHIEAVISKFEADVEAARQTLITQIDASNPKAVVTKSLLERHREWEQVHHWDTILDPRLKRTIDSLSFALKRMGDREYCTFEEADQVRELCRKEVRSSAYTRAYLSQHGVPSDDLAWSMFEALTKEMDATAKRIGLEKEWQFYDEGKRWLWEGTGSPWHYQTRHVIEGLRRAFGRGNSEATLREISSAAGGLRLGVDQLEWLKNYGFDKALVERELQAGWDFVRKQEKTQKRKEERRMFEAAADTFALNAKARERGAPGLITG